MTARLMPPAALAVAVLAVLVLLVAGVPSPGPLWARWLTLGWITVAGLAGWVVVAAQPWRGRGFAVAGAAVISSTTVIAAVASPWPSLSYPAAFTTLALAGVAMGVFSLATSSIGRRTLLGAATALLLFLLATFGLQVGVLWSAWLGLGMPVADIPLRPGSVGGAAGIPTWMADYVVLLAPITVVGAWASGRRGRFGAVLLAVGATAAIIVSGTRSIWLIAAILYLSVILWWLRSRDRRIAVAVLVGFVALTGVALALGLPERVARDLDEGRSSAAATAVRLFVDDPVLGSGPGTYGIRRLEDPGDTLDHYALPNALNVPLTVAGESGMVGLVGLTTAAVVILLAARRDWPSDERGRRLALAAALGVAAIGGHAMVDVVIEVRALLVAAFAVAAIGLVPAPPIGATVEGHPGHRRPAIGAGSSSIRAAAIVALGGLALLSLPAMRAEAAWAEIWLAGSAMTTAPADAMAHARAATELAPDLAPAWNTLLLAADASGDEEVVADALSRMQELDTLAQHASEAAVVQARRAPADAAEAASSVIDHEMHDPFVALQAAVLADMAGLASDRDAALTLLVRLDAFIAQADGLPPGLVGRLEEATTAALPGMLAQERWDDALGAALAAGGVGVRDVIAAAPADRQPVLTDVAAAWAGDPAARASVDAVAARRPKDLLTVRWSWLLAARACDLAAADRWWAIAWIGTGASLALPAEVGAAEPTWKMRPVRYPQAVWGPDLPPSPYVDGTWSLRYGRPGCATP